jgi:hypothetical protein
VGSAQSLLSKSFAEAYACEDQLAQKSKIRIARRISRDGTVKVVELELRNVPPGGGTIKTINVDEAEITLGSGS